MNAKVGLTFDSGQAKFLALWILISLRNFSRGCSGRVDHEGDAPAASVLNGASYVIPCASATAR